MVDSEKDVKELYRMRSSEPVELKESKNGTKAWTWPHWHVDDNLDIDPGTGYCKTYGNPEAGYWGVEAWLDHQSFWGCWYRLGIQFGTMQNGQFVALTPIYWGKKQYHNNGDRKYHQGQGVGPEILVNYPAITTAQRWAERSSNGDDGL